MRLPVIPPRFLRPPHLFIVVPLAALAVTVLLLLTRPPVPVDADSRNLALMEETVRLVQGRYVESVAPAEKMPTALDALVTAADPRGAYLDARLCRRYRLLAQRRAWSGGAIVTRFRQRIVVSAVPAGSPAAAAGLRRGDILKTVDGRRMYDVSYWTAFLALQREEAGAVALVVQRDGGNIRLSLPTVAPGAVPVVRDLGEDAFLISLPRLDAAAVAELGRLPDRPGMRVVFDLRGSEWGDFPAFQEAARLLFPPTELILRQKEGDRRLVIGSPRPRSWRAVVLVDESTRMYQELLAALWQRNGTLLLGRPTAGFCAEVELHPLDDGRAVLLSRSLFRLGDAPLAERPLTPTAAELPQAAPDAAREALRRLQTHP